MRGLVLRYGLYVRVRTPVGTWRVPRHFIALHGLKAEELPALAKTFEWEKEEPH